MYVLILIALVVGTIALTRNGVLPQQPGEQANPLAILIGLGVLIQAGVLTMIGAVMDAAERRGLPKAKFMGVVRNIAMTIAVALMLLLLMAGCAPKPLVGDVTANPEVMAGQETIRAPRAWGDFCARPENQPDPAC